VRPTLAETTSAARAIADGRDPPQRRARALRRRRFRHTIGTSAAGEAGLRAIPDTRAPHGGRRFGGLSESGRFVADTPLVRLPWEVDLRTYKAPRMRRRAAAFVVAALLLVCLLAVGCSRSDDGGDGSLVTTLVGRVKASGAFVAINSFRNGDLVAYVCDGKSGVTLNGDGRTSDGRIGLISKNGAKISGNLSERAASGTFALPDGKRAVFTARPPRGRAVADRMARCRRLCE
jgi:hypothetical protein